MQMPIAELLFRRSRKIDHFSSKWGCNFAAPFLFWYNIYMPSTIRKILSCVLVSVFLLATAVASFAPVFAESSDFSLDDSQIGAISQNCASIKQSLRALQRTDARTRAYLGSLYESLLSDYITPMDLRLINVSQPNPDLTEIHSNVIDLRQEFIHRYTTYSQSLENLINSDCQNSPVDFYQRLSETREKRASVASTTNKLRRLFSDHLTIVKKLKSNLGAKNASSETN